MLKKIFVLTFVFAVFVTSCMPSFPVFEQPAYQVSKVSENWDFVVVNRSGTMRDPNNITAVGYALSQWEQANSDRRLVSMQIVYDPNDSYPGRIDGISIYSELR